MRRELILAFALAAASFGCAPPPRVPPPPNAPRPPDIAPAEDAPTLRTMPTPPGREGDVPGPPPAIKP